MPPPTAPSEPWSGSPTVSRSSESPSGSVQSSATSTGVPVSVVAVTGSQVGAWFGGGMTVSETVAGAESAVPSEAR